MNFGDQGEPSGSCAAGPSRVICGKRNAPVSCPARASRAWGPPASSRQYQRAKTKTLLTHSSAADRSSSTGGSLCAGKAAIKSASDQRMKAVRTAERTCPSTIFARSRRSRCRTIVQIVSAATIASNSHRGPIESDSGKAAYNPPTARLLRIASVRDSGGLGEEAGEFASLGSCVTRIGPQSTQRPTARSIDSHPAVFYNHRR